MSSKIHSYFICVWLAIYLYRNIGDNAYEDCVTRRNKNNGYIIVLFGEILKLQFQCCSLCFVNPFETDDVCWVHVNLVQFFDFGLFSSQNYVLRLESFSSH